MPDYKVVFEDADTIRQRRISPVEGSYTNYLFDKGIEKICRQFMLSLEMIKAFFTEQRLRLGNAIQANLTAIAEACAFFDRLENKRNNGMEHTGQSFFLYLCGIIT